jgi:hypothetical protein
MDDAVRVPEWAGVVRPALCAAAYFVGCLASQSLTAAGE